jgi:hypothetical protein
MTFLDLDRLMHFSTNFYFYGLIGDNDRNSNVYAENPHYC